MFLTHTCQNCMVQKYSPGCKYDRRSQSCLWSTVFRTRKHFYFIAGVWSQNTSQSWVWKVQDPGQHNWLQTLSYPPKSIKRIYSNDIFVLPCLYHTTVHVCSPKSRFASDEICFLQWSLDHTNSLFGCVLVWYTKGISSVLLTLKTFV